MKSRTIASLATAGVILLAATGCGTITTQATTFVYTASDGVNLPEAEGDGLDVRNVLVVADHDGAEGNLIAVAVNNSDSDQVLAVDWGSGDATIDVPAGETVSLGATHDPELLTGLNSLPGTTASMYIQPGQGDGVEIEVPVLDNCLTEYATLAPNDEHDPELCEPVSEVETEH